MIRTILTRIISAFGIFFILALVVGFVLPNRYTVERTIDIDASKADIFAYLSDLERWSEWQPWTERDPDLKVELGDVTSGVGATQQWEGAEGDGSLVFTEVDPRSGIRFDLFFNQGKAQCDCTIRFESVGEKERVTWTMHGQIPVPVMGGYLAMSMDSIIGPAFDSGLQNLKAVVESR